MGFAVTRISAGVVRDDTGLPSMGSHLALLVMLDRPWLVDGGFGSWIGAPLPLERGAWALAPWPVAIDLLNDGRWELRVDLGAYLAGLPAPVPGRTVPVRTLADAIAFDRAHADAEMRWFGQDQFETAERTTDKAAYAKARANSLRLAGKDGIDRMLAAHHVALLIAPTAGPAWPIDLVTGDHGLQLGAGSLPAIAGYPHLTVPMGAVEGLPVGLSFIGTAWDDAAVLKAGAAYESARTA
eukprot:gene14579-18451_t